MFLFFLIPLSACASFKVKMSEDGEETDIPFIKREEWSMYEPRAVKRIGKAVNYVLIHETYFYLPTTYCTTIEDCKKVLRRIQYIDMKNIQDDIAFNFAIGGTEEPAVYEGRGWDVYNSFNNHSNQTNVSIGFIGEYTSKPPLPIYLIVMRLLLEDGVKKGYIVPDYKIVPHEFFPSNTSDTTESCVGDGLYQSMGTWKNIKKD